MILQRTTRNQKALDSGWQLQASAAAVQCAQVWMVMVVCGGGDDDSNA